jgi:hypothetical protein
MKEILTVFGSIVGIVSGAVLLYANVIRADISYLEPQAWAVVGVLLMAAGITGLWLRARETRR